MSLEFVSWLLHKMRKVNGIILLFGSSSKLVSLIRRYTLHGPYETSELFYCVVIHCNCYLVYIPRKIILSTKGGKQVD